MADPNDGNGPVLRNDILAVNELLTENTTTLHQQCECAESEPALDDFGGAGEEMQDLKHAPSGSPRGWQRQSIFINVACGWPGDLETVLFYVRDIRSRGDRFF
jgi:hypothetical protein